MKQTIRFFSYCLNEDTDADICEVSETTFKSLKGEITYERHTVFENGCDQVYLTIEPLEYPLECEVKL